MGQLIDELFDANDDPSKWWIEAEFDAMVETDSAEQRIAEHGWIHDLSVFRPEPDARPIGPVTTVRRPSTLGCHALMSAPDLDEAVWRLKVLLRSLGLMSGGKGLTALSIVAIEDQAMTLRQLEQVTR